MRSSTEIDVQCIKLATVVGQTMTNYELLRWLVETPSRDVEHYHMLTAGPSAIADACN